MNEINKSFALQIRQINDLIELKQFLNDSYNNLNSIEEKEVLLDYLEFDYLFKLKLESEHNKAFAKPRSIIYLMLQSTLQKTGFIEKWMNEKRKNISENPPHPILEDTSNNLPEIELKTQQEQIRLLYDLGIIDFLQNQKFKATLNGNVNQTANLISKILRLNSTSIQPTLNALLSNNVNKNYPKETARTKAIINQLNANELK